MFLTKIFHFLKGYVILSITGENKEKIISEFSQKGLFDIEYAEDALTAKMPFGIFKECELPADAKVIKKVGIPFFAEAVKRKRAAFITLAVFVLIAAIGAQFIWSIEFDAEKGVDLEAVSAAADPEMPPKK